MAEIALPDILRIYGKYVRETSGRNEETYFEQAEQANVQPNVQHSGKNLRKRG